MVISVGRNHSRVAVHLAVVKPAGMPPITIICSLVMIKFANIMAEFTMNSSYFVISMMMMMVVVILFCVSSRWSNKHCSADNRSGSDGRQGLESGGDFASHGTRHSAKQSGEVQRL